MEKGKNWGAIDLSTLEGYAKLGQREQKAVSVALYGLDERERTGFPPSPMLVRVTETPFDFRGFADVLDRIGVGIADTLNESRPGIYTFQPTPYDRKFSDPSLEQLRQTVDEELSGLPQELKDLFGKSGFFRN